MISEEKQRRVFDLRTAGMTYVEIAKKVGVARSTAQTIVQRGMVLKHASNGHRVRKADEPPYALFGKRAEYRKCKHGLMRHPCLACYLESLDSQK